MDITVKFAEENRGKRFDIVLTDGTILKNIGFFVYGNSVCYMTSRQKRQGRYVPYYWDIKSITEVVKKEPSVKGNAKKILNRLHENVWTNLIEEYKGILNGDEPSQDFKWHFMGKLNFRNISTLFKYEPSRFEQLKQAFENKTEFSWRREARGHQGRDLSISTRLCEDGIFRAWFSSEYPGCGNGDYYLLLSPTTAIYYERD